MKICHKQLRNFYSRWGQTNRSGITLLSLQNYQRHELKAVQLIASAIDCRIQPVPLVLSLPGHA